MCKLLKRASAWLTEMRDARKRYLDERRAQPKSEPEHPYYTVWGPQAERVKVALQMAIGILVVLLLGARIASHFYELRRILGAIPSVQGFVVSTGTLAIVSKGLAYSAGLDLAYMLFTQGIDEAFDPVVLALASAVIFLASKEPITWGKALAALLLTMSIGVVYWVKRKVFEVPKPQSEGRPEAPARPTRPD